jgi:hypothetical protein
VIREKGDGSGIYVAVMIKEPTFPGKFSLDYIIV